MTRKVSHRQAADMHCNARIRERLMRVPTKYDKNKMRLALVKNNSDCFLRRVYDDAIEGICRYQNRWTTAVYDKKLGIVVTVCGDL